MRRGAALLGLATALLAAGCGTGGISKGGDQDAGKKLFLAKCGGCHTMADAGTHGTSGPNLDDAFGPSRKQGFEPETIQQVVRQQIQLAEPPMPEDLVTGGDADDVAAYVATVAGSGATSAKTSTSGKDIFVANCGSCHTLADAGTSASTGPDLDTGLKGKDAAFIKQSIIDPDAVVTQGYNKGIMPNNFGQTLSAAEQDALVSYLLKATGG